MESTKESSHVSRPSRLNGESIAGASFLFFSFLFMVAGQLNKVFGGLYPVDYVMAAFGVGLVLLGYRTWRNDVRRLTPGYEPSHGY